MHVFMYKFEFASALWPHKFQHHSCLLDVGLVLASDLGTGGKRCKRLDLSLEAFANLGCNHATLSAHTHTHTHTSRWTRTIVAIQDDAAQIRSCRIGSHLDVDVRIVCLHKLGLAQYGRVSDVCAVAREAHRTFLRSFARD